MKIRLLRKTRFFTFNEEDGTLGGSGTFTDAPANTVLPATNEGRGMYLVRCGELAARVWASDVSEDLRGGYDPEFGTSLARALHRMAKRGKR